MLIPTFIIFCNFCLSIPTCLTSMHTCTETQGFKPYSCTTTTCAITHMVNVSIRSITSEVYTSSHDYPSIKPPNDLPRSCQPPLPQYHARVNHPCHSTTFYSTLLPAYQTLVPPTELSYHPTSLSPLHRTLPLSQYHPPFYQTLAALHTPT